MINIDTGLAAKVVTANIEEAMAILIRDEFQSYWDEALDAKVTFDDWAADRGTCTFATFLPGSVPDILLRYWLLDTHDIDPADFDPIEIKGPGDANAIFCLWGAGRSAPFLSECRGRDQGSETAPVIVFTSTVRPGLPPPAVEQRDKPLVGLPSLIKREKTRATAVVAACRPGRSGTLRTTQRGTTSMESRTAVGAFPARSDAEAGSADLRTEAGSAEGVGWGSSPRSPVAVRTAPASWSGCRRKSIRSRPRDA